MNAALVSDIWYTHADTHETGFAKMTTVYHCASYLPTDGQVCSGMEVRRGGSQLLVPGYFNSTNNWLASANSKLLTYSALHLFCETLHSGL